MKRIIILILTLILLVPTVSVADRHYDAIPDNWVDVWIFCNEGSEVSIRSEPGKNAHVICEAYVGDHFYADGRKRNGWIRIHGLNTEADFGWIYSGHASYTKPIEIDDYHYVRTEGRKVKVRKCIDGKRIDWVYDDDYIRVYYASRDWCITSRGYIMTEFIDIDYEYYVMMAERK